MATTNNRIPTGQSVSYFSCRLLCFQKSSFSVATWVGRQTAALHHQRIKKRRPHLLPPGINSGRKHAFPQPAQSIVGTLQHHSPILTTLPNKNLAQSSQELHLTALGLPLGPQAERQGRRNSSCPTLQRTPHSTADDTSQWR